MVLREFDLSTITKRHSKDLRKEFSRLEILGRQTSAKFRLVGETHDMVNHNVGMKRKRTVETDEREPKKRMV